MKVEGRVVRREDGKTLPGARKPEGARRFQFLNFSLLIFSYRKLYPEIVPNLMMESKI